METSTNVQILKQETLLGKQFNIYGDFENPLFLAKDVAEWIEHSNPTEMGRSVDDDEKQVLITPSKDCLVGLQSNTQYTFLTENGVYEVLMLSRKPIAKQFKKGVKEILKSIRKYGAYITPNQSNILKAPINDAILLVDATSRMLNLNENSKLLMIHKVAEVYNVDKKILPQYTPSKNTVLSASELLNRFGKPCSIHKFNTLMCEFGLLAYKERPSKSKGVKRFPSLTNEGLKFGENQNSPNNPLQTQTLYYEETFEKLLSLLNLRLAA